MKAILLALFLFVSGATAGVTILTAPLNSIMYPLGYRANTTLAASYEMTPVDQYAVFIPLNASSITILLRLPSDPNNGYIDLDYSFLGPLCSYEYQLDVAGNTCGGGDSNSYRSTGSSYNLTFSPGSAPVSGLQWRTNTYLYFGFTSDSVTSNTYSIAYVIQSIDIITCSAGTVGGVEDSTSNTLCLPLVQLPSNGSAPFNYVGLFAGGRNGMVFQTVVAPNTGYLTATIVVPYSNGVAGISSYVYGAAFGVPSSTHYECSDSSSSRPDALLNATIITWTCPAPTAGTYYIYFRNDYDSNFVATIQLASTICTAGTGGDNCSVALINGGSIPTANNVTTSKIAVDANSGSIFVLTVPNGTDYPFNVTFNAGTSIYVYAKPNSYATDMSSGGYPNTNWRVSAVAGENAIFSFLAQNNHMGSTLYFSVNPGIAQAGSNVSVNVTISSAASVVPTITTMVSATTTGTATGTTTKINTTGTATGTATGTTTRTNTTGTATGTATGTTTRTNTTGTTHGTSTSPSSASTLVVCVAMSVLALFL